MSTVLVLGAGRVAGPAIRILLEKGHRVRLAADDLGAARALAGSSEGVHVEQLDARDPDAVRRAVSASDLALSLLPASLHAPVARACIAERRPFLSTSYVSPEITAMDPDARAQGVLLLNECGLDPGLDHLLAVDLVESARERGARVVAFRSVCGGIPAPESNDNPFGYKISWSPRGVALAGTRAARWLERGRVLERGPGEIFRDPRPMDVDGLGRLELYPNGDAIPYATKYGIERVDTIFRGTFRWPGWCSTWRAIAGLGCLDDAARAVALRPLDVERTLGGGASSVLERLRWLGLFDAGAAAAAAKRGLTRLDHLVALMETRMTYAPGERDLVVLVDEVTIDGADSARRVKTAPCALAATIVARGEAHGETAMARLVGVPAGLAACRILDQTIDAVGVQVPVDPRLVRTLLDDLAHAGIEPHRSERPAPESES